MTITYYVGLARYKRQSASASGKQRDYLRNASVLSQRARFFRGQPELSRSCDLSPNQ
jgi:hypothetical protein